MKNCNIIHSLVFVIQCMLVQKTFRPTTCTCQWLHTVRILNLNNTARCCRVYNVIFCSTYRLGVVDCTSTSKDADLLNHNNISQRNDRHIAHAKRRMSSEAPTSIGRWWRLPRRRTPHRAPPCEELDPTTIFLRFTGK